MKADKSLLQQIVAGLSEGVIIIDPDQTISWANQAALAMHGVEQVEDLGRTVGEYRKQFRLRYRNNHPLRSGQYPVDRVVAGEQLHDVIVEVSRRGDPDVTWVHRIRSLVAVDQEGAPDCLVLIIHDASERFEAEERFEATFAANPAPAVICRLADRRYVKVNVGFLEMTGFRREAILDRSMDDIDVLAAAERRDFALERLAAGATIPQMEAALRLPAGGSKSVIVAGQPIEMGDEPCMLFTFADLEPRTRVETVLRQSEERFQKAFRLSPVPIVLMSGDSLGILGVNNAFAATFGWTDTDAVGRTFHDLDLWARPDDATSFEAAIRKDGRVEDQECCIRTRDGRHLDCLASADTASINDSTSVLCVLQDISDRKRSERKIAAAIDAAMVDTTWLTKSIMSKLSAIRRTGSADAANVEALSTRERQVLSMIAQGLTDAEIGQRLSVARNTVRNHVNALYRRLGVHSRSEAIVWANANGLAPPSGAAERPPDRPK